MSFRTDRPGYELRDRHGASRAVAYLALAGAPYLFITGLLTPGVSRSVITGVVLATILVTGIGAVSWRRPQAMPRAFWLIAPALATLLITVLNLATRDPSTGSQLFYLWPVLYAANFLGRRLIHLNLVLIFGGNAATVFTLLRPGGAVADWFAMVLAATMTAVVVGSLRARADRLRTVLEQQANADALTGLANRRSFTEALRHEVAAARSAGRSLALVTVDLDHFKTINDTYGHLEGDRALQAVATAMRTVTGDSGIAARLGGDEFVMLLRMGGTPAAVVAEALARAVAATTDMRGGPLSLSIGVAALPGDAATAEDLVAASDAALYDAKASGRAASRWPRTAYGEIRNLLPDPRR
ncbi:diguanylate cyclase domain-containing protein [Actinoplanes sp. NPDC049681]|uniref:GGDEF domain-containing protein n=1 Tax=Actinoplanes sp. NPDC049681 TaxID=3363905 RepID=UPI00379C76FA